MYPQGASGKQRSIALRRLDIFLYLPGVNTGGVSDFSCAVKRPMGKTTVYEDVQAAGEALLKLCKNRLKSD